MEGCFKGLEFDVKGLSGSRPSVDIDQMKWQADDDHPQRLAASWCGWSWWVRAICFYSLWFGHSRVSRSDTGDFKLKTHNISTHPLIWWPLHSIQHIHADFGKSTWISLFFTSKYHSDGAQTQTQRFHCQKSRFCVFIEMKPYTQSKPDLR